MSCNTTTSMYLGVSTTICASASASRSGSTITVSGTFSVSQGNSWNLNAIYAYVDGKTGWTKVKPYGNSGGTWTAGFSFSFTDNNAGSPSYSAVFQVFNNAESAGVGGTASAGFSVSYSANAVAPTTPTVSAVRSPSHPTDTIEVTWGTTSFGVPSSGTVYLYAGTSASPTAQYLSKTTTGNSTWGHNEPLIPNTAYYYRARAYNGQWSSYSPDATAITDPIPPVITIDSVTFNSATFTISAPSQGSARTLKALYKIDNDPVTETMVTPPATVTQSFLPGSTHTISAYFSASPTVSSTTVSETFTLPVSFYGSVNGETKAITKLYGSVNGETKLIQHLYGSVNHDILTGITGIVQAGGIGNVTAFDGETLMGAIEDTPDLADYILDNGKTVSYIEFYVDDGGDTWSAELFYTDSSSTMLGGNYLGAPISDPADLGITASYVDDGSDIIMLTGTYTPTGMTKLIF